MVAIEASSLVKTLSGEISFTLINDISFAIGKGEFVVITGPSGSGKSSLLYLLGLLDTPTSGRVILNGIDTSKFNDRERARFRLSSLGFVFQFHFLLPEFTALENVMLPMQRLGRLSENDMRDRAMSLLSSFGLEDQSKKLPKQMSGGQSQRVAIARALANAPSIILADEPTGNLDSVSTENVKNVLMQLAEKGGHTVVVVTHDTQFAASAHRAIHVVDGRVVGSNSH